MIKIKNIYYMLSYAYQDLSIGNYRQLGVEDFENIQDLLAEILIKGVKSQLRVGLTRDYETVTDISSVLRGKIDFAQSLKTRALDSHKLVCRYGLYSDNNIFNQILKSTMLMLLHSRNVCTANKHGLRNIILRFDGVELINCTHIDWKSLSRLPNSHSYRLLMNICYLVIKGLLLTTDEGKYQLAEYMDDQQMYHLYEHFVLEYFKKEHKELHARAAYIDWNTDNGYIEFLPQMKSDIMLEYKNRTLIIDTKYYSKSMISSQYGSKETIISANLYQIFAYVKNYDVDQTGNVSGMLLYAKTDEATVPDKLYQLSGNHFFVRSLDLNSEWEYVVAQLENIVALLKN